MSTATAELLLLYSTDIIHTLTSCDKMTYTDIPYTLTKFSSFNIAGFTNVYQNNIQNRKTPR